MAQISNDGLPDGRTPPQTPAKPSRRITEKLSGEALHAETGKDWPAWFAVLDAWNATARTHTEIARHLVEAHGMAGWYAQSVTVGYEQERGLRQPGQSSTGVWQTSASRTLRADPARTLAAFTDDAVRRRWLPGDGFALRTHRPAKSLTADLARPGLAGRLSVGVTPRGTDRTLLAVGHTKLADADAVAAAKAFWKDRLQALKDLLEP
ncbi:hypothetical protein [Streptomyces sp. NPDC051561]|uniref:hypothetical protein n=1 Tax=Streptomyces sp. NPDC051561 TaxID=3365658 RepID=UPI0037AD9DFB